MGASNSRHTAFLYQHDEARVDAVVHFVGDGLPHDERILVVTPAAEWTAMAQRLRAAGADPTPAQDRGTLIVAEPEAILSETMTDGVLDGDRLRHRVHDLLGTHFPPHRVYGDAAGALVGVGNASAALALEHWWTEVTEQHETRVCCGHPLQHFAEPDGTWQLRSVVNAHDELLVERDVSVKQSRRVAGAPRHGELILLCDEYDDSRILYAEALTHDGYCVMTARDEWDAVRLGLAYRPHVVILDVSLPGHESTAAMSLLKAARDGAATVLALTAHAFPRELERIRTAGFDAVLSKPCLPDELVWAVDNVVERRRDS